MNKILYFVAFLCFLSCSSGKLREQPNLEKAIEAAGLSENMKDSLFLGFNFSMDSCTTQDRIDSLIQIGKLFHKDGYLRYSFNIDPVSYSPAVGFIYTKYTLSKVSLVFFSEDYLTVEFIKNSITAHVFRTFSNRGFSSFEKKNKFDSDDYYFVKNNTIVSIIAYEHFVIMSYSNAITDKEGSGKVQKEKLLKSEETLSDL